MHASSEQIIAPSTFVIALTAENAFWVTLFGVLLVLGYLVSKVTCLKRVSILRELEHVLERLHIHILS